MIHFKKIAYSRIVAFGLALITASLLPSVANASACSLPSTDYGTVSSTVSVPTAATYRIWSRMIVPDTTNTTYALEIDGQTCFIIGGSSVSTSSWTWVDYQNGNTTDKAQLSLAKGSHTLKMIGLKPNVQLDKVIMISDTTCVPTGFGDNCNTPTDTTAPTVALTAPTEGVTVTGTVPISATASDNIGVDKVEFYLNSTLLGTDITAPYGLDWNSASMTNSTYTLTAKAYDVAGNFASDVHTVTSQNGDTSVPTAPTNLKVTATAYNKVSLSWQASTDNVGVTGYTVFRNGTPIAQVGTVANYQDTTVSSNTKYSYQVTARDAAGNQSAASTNVSVTTPTVPDSQAPSTPTGLNGTAASASQINLSWQSSTDNIGVTGYDVYRATGNGSLQKIATATSTSFGDTNLASNTTYNYAVRARDAAGNVSPNSTKVKVTTKTATTSSTISGSVKRSNGNALTNARVVLQINGSKRIYTTDSAGRYTIQNLPAGRYDLTYRATGYYPKSYSLRTTADNSITQNVTLQKR